MKNLRTRLSFGLTGIVAMVGLMASTAQGFADGWASIAVDKKGNYGFAVGYANASEARKASVKGCGAASCRSVLLKQTTCVAMTDARGADGGYWFWVAYGPDEGETSSQVETWCSENPEAADAGCELRISNCQ